MRSLLVSLPSYSTTLPRKTFKVLGRVRRVFHSKKNSNFPTLRNLFFVFLSGRLLLNTCGTPLTDSCCRTGSATAGNYALNIYVYIVLLVTNVFSLADRRQSHHLSSLHELLSGSVDSPSLLALIVLKIR